MYLSNAQILEMARAAVTAYEYACEWKAAERAAREYAQDEWGVTPRKSAVLLAVKMAKLNWQAQTLAVKRAVNY